MITNAAPTATCTTSLLNGPSARRSSISPTPCSTSIPPSNPSVIGVWYCPPSTSPAMSSSAGKRSMITLPATLTASSVASIGSATDQKIATPPPSGIGSWWILRVPGRSTSPRRGANRFIASVMSHERTKLTAARIRMGTIMRGAAREDNRAAQSKKEETPNRGLSVHLPCKPADAIGGPVRSRQSRPQVLDLRLDLLELPVQHPLVLRVVRVLHPAADVAGLQLKAFNFGNR